MMTIQSADIWIVVIGMLCAVPCALVGTYLVLRRMSMMGDAISHAVLAGIAGGFLLVVALQNADWIAAILPARWYDAFRDADPRHPVFMFTGAVIIGMLTALLTQWVHTFGKVKRGAAMGVVFTSLFAMGLVLMVRAADFVDLDPSCVLYGAIESSPLVLVKVFGIEMPRSVPVLGGLLVLDLVFVLLFYKELKITSFDPELATALGINAGLMHYMLMSMVAITTVASFEVVGSILVIAFLIVPAATACLLTDRMSVLLVLACILGGASAILGHVGAIALPAALGFDGTSSAGMMATMTGVLFTVTVLVAPRHGVIAKALRRLRLQLLILQEDILGLLYRIEERPEAQRSIAALPGRGFKQRLALWLLQRRQDVQRTSTAAQLRLTETGRRRAANVIRRHRLWETYLHEVLNIAPDHIHGTAHRMEHISAENIQQRLAEVVGSPATDPHGSPVPDKQENARNLSNDGDNTNHDDENDDNRGS